MRSHDPAAIGGDLADFADGNEVAVLCDWGISIVATVVLVLNQQAISVHGAEKLSLILDQFHTKI